MLVVHILVGLLQGVTGEAETQTVAPLLHAFDLVVLSTYYFWESRRYTSLKRAVKPREDDHLVDSLGSAGRIALGFVHRFTEVFFVLGVALRCSLAAWLTRTAAGYLLDMLK